MTPELAATSLEKIVARPGASKSRSTIATR